MLFPSKTETQGLTAVESIMSGTPVIGINEMGIKNVITNGVSGFLTNEDVDEYADVAIDVLKDGHKQKELSEKAKLAGQQYSHETTGKMLEDIYQECIKTRSIKT